MATNIISTISQVLTPDLLARIASALGLDRYLVDKAIGAAVPALLAAFTSRASTAEGAAGLNDAIGNQKPGALTNLANQIGGSGQAALIDQGINALSSVLGRGATGEITTALGKFAGVDGAGSRSILGLLGPVVMNVLGQQQRSTGLNASQILASQKDNIERALPRGFADYLSGADTTADAGTRSPPRAVEPDKRRPWEKPAAETSWLLPALALAAIGGLAWYLLSGPTAPPTQTVEVQKTAVPQADESPIVTGAIKPAALDATEAFRPLNGVKVGEVDLGAQLTNAVNHLRSSIEGIKDEATANTALPTLTSSKDEFNRVSGLINQLTPETRKTLASAIAAVRPAIDQMLNKALAIPGVGSVIKPTVDTIRSEIDVLATA